eukprot:505808-Prymnesium_polylepis.1
MIFPPVDWPYLMPPVTCRSKRVYGRGCVGDRVALGLLVRFLQHREGTRGAKVMVEGGLAPRAKCDTATP